MKICVYMSQKDMGETFEWQNDLVTCGEVMTPKHLKEKGMPFIEKVEVWEGGVMIEEFDRILDDGNWHNQKTQYLLQKQQSVS
jgi:hypothetical protein